MITPAELEVLVEEWGGQRVEKTMIFIEHSEDARGLLVSIPPTAARVGAVLEAVYGEYEPAPGSLAGIDLDKPNYGS